MPRSGPSNLTTTYAVSIDGQPAPVHMMVDTDGQLWSHLCPYRTFGNATELLRYLLEHVPEALTGIELGGHEHEHVHAAANVTRTRRGQS